MVGAGLRSEERIGRGNFEVLEHWQVLNQRSDQVSMQGAIQSN
jgi:hypothetical protein